jgi:hypothetical protein
MILQYVPQWVNTEAFSTAQRQNSSHMFGLQVITPPDRFLSLNCFESVCDYELLI